MSKEIERKFLVKGDYKKESFHSFSIIQGYLSSAAERSVRVRIQEDGAFLTIKGVGNESGITRFEWEREISVEDAKELLKICEPGIIEKTRFLVEIGEHTFEIDEFQGDNAGLILAELELSTEGEHFEKPEWLGKEVSGEEKYYNIMLTTHPYKNWE